MRTRHSVTIALVLIAPCQQAWAAAGDVQLASRASGATGVKGQDHASEPRLSADGRFVAFATTAANLDPADADGAMPDVYVRDLLTSATTLVSRADGLGGAKGDGASRAPAISADGRFVAFVSGATNLSPAKPDPVDGVFLRDLQRGTTTLVSQSSTGQPADAGSDSPAISADGRVVAFASDATNLAAGDADGLTDVFARDVVAGTTVLVSGAGVATETGGSSQPSISGDGAIVAFSSTATALHPDDSDPLSDVYARNLRTGALSLVSRSGGADGGKGDGHSDSPSVSGDGRNVAFSSTSTNLDPLDVDTVADVFVRSLALGTTAIVSLRDGPAGGKGDADAGGAAISQTGRFVAFTSLSDLDAADLDALADVYSRDVAGGGTRLISRAAGVLGAKGDGASGAASISANARFVAYGSAATNLHPDDQDALTDVFVRDALGPVLPLSPEPPRMPRRARLPGMFAVAPVSCPVDGTVTALTRRGDVRAGGSGSDILLGRGGRDVLRGMGGRDCLYGGPGADRLFGGSGGDVLDGGSGGDVLNGGAGGDRLTDAHGTDRFSGGAGNDALDARDAARGGRRRPDRISCGAGRRDRARVDRVDVVAGDCERIVRAKAAR